MEWDSLAKRLALILIFLTCMVYLLIPVSGYTLASQYNNQIIYTSALGIQPWTQGDWVFLEATSGLINSSTNAIHIWGDGSGDLSITNNESVSFTVSYSTLEVFYRLNMSNWRPCENLTSLTVNPTGTVAIKWRSPIFDVWRFFDTIGIGFSGIILTCIGSFYTARKARGINEPYDLYLLMMGIVIAIIGMGLIVAWLW